MERLFRAIDTGDLDDARALAKSLAGVAGGVKLGTTFVVENGRGGVAEAGLPVWPDLKLLEIPRNVARAVRARLGPDVLLVAPGIRPVWSRTDDWTHIVTPGDALRRGAAYADYLVVGRPITQADDPRAAAARIAEEMASAIG